MARHGDRCPRHPLGAAGRCCRGHVILIYDQLVFRPIVAWADKFRFEQTAARYRPRSWVYELWRRGRLDRRLSFVGSWLMGRVRDPGERRKLPE